MAGKGVREKGKRGERELVRILREEGIEARRVPLSGSVEGYEGDVVLQLGDRQLVGEVKLRKDGFKSLYRWLKGKDLLFIRSDRHEWLVVMRLEDWASTITRERIGDVEQRSTPKYRRVLPHNNWDKNRVRTGGKHESGRLLQSKHCGTGAGGIFPPGPEGKDQKVRYLPGIHDCS